MRLHLKYWALALLFMRTIAEWLLLREAASAELRVLNCAGDIAIRIDEIHSACNSDRSTLRINESFDLINVGIVTHGYGLIEIVAKCLRT